MTDAEQLERYRRMPPAERWELWRELSEFGMSVWESNLTVEEMARRWRIWREEHDASDRNMLRAFREAR